MCDREITSLHEAIECPNYPEFIVQIGTILGHYCHIHLIEYLRECMDDEGIKVWSIEAEIES